MSNCHCNTDIILDGSGQLGRYLKALDPSYAPIDDRSIDDLLVFAKRYAGQIRFYDIPGSCINDGVQPGKVSWREFFRRDMAVIAASVAVLNITNLKKEYDELRERLDTEPSPEKLAAAFALSISMAVRIDRWYSVAIPENPLRIDLDLAINSHLRSQMKRIMAYEDGYKFIDSRNPFNLDYAGIENDEIWGLKDAVDPDATIYQGSTLEDKIRYGALYADEIFNDFFSTLQNFIDKGPDYMAFALEQYPAHQPHMALFIAFLQIFKLAQEQMNGLTGKMLDFYYKEVLQLTPKDSIPDRTHVIFELAKDVAQYDVAAGTAMDAGKDASNKPQVYKTVSDLVVNQAKVAELKTLFIEKNSNMNAIGTAISNIKTIYARPVANSADGYGAPFETENPKWPTFGKGATNINSINNICQFTEAAADALNTKNEAQLGFSIASPQLVLQGGNRIIALKLPALAGDISQKQLEIWLSAEEGWLKIGKKITANNAALKALHANGGDLSTAMPQESGYFFDTAVGTLYICLPIVEKAIVPFDGKLHTGRNYTTPYPVMQVLMGPDIGIMENVFNTLSINNLSLSVRVGSINQQPLNQVVTISGKVFDIQTGAPIRAATVTVVQSKPLVETTTNQAGEFSITLPLNKVLGFSVQGYISKAMIVKNSANLEVGMTRGEGFEDFSFKDFIIPSYFDGLKQLALQNDDGAIDVNKPFDPFTAYPKFGSSLYIGSDEVFNKPVDELAIHIKHVSDTNDNLLDIDYSFLYQNNPAELSKISIYKLSMLANKQWQDLCTPAGGDFMEGFLTRDVLYKRNPAGTGAQLPAVPRTPLAYSTEFTNKTIKGFLQLRNNIQLEEDTTNNNNGIKDRAGLSASMVDLKAFMADGGEKEMAAKMLSTVTAAAATTGEKDIFQKMAELALFLKVKEISVSYFSELKSLDPEIDQFFHVYPFGMLETFTQPVTAAATAGNTAAAAIRNKLAAFNAITKSTINFQQLDAAKDYLLVDAKQLLLPQFTYKGFYSNFEQGQATASQAASLAGYGTGSYNNLYQQSVLNKMVLTASRTIQKFEGGNNQYSGNIEEEGMLFIGLEKAVPLQSVSMLFQFAEGSAADEDNDPPVIHWSYLTNNEWRPMRGEDVVSDGTYGFQTTGIVKLNIPADATSNNTIITKGLHWFAVSVTENAHRIPQLVNIVTQAAEVVFEDNNNDQAHFDTALPASSITKLAVKVAQVSKVEQPFASFDGKHKEINKEFYTRVSERLRHKGRAINSWDYEHLVLDRFPSVYKVKCITATDPNCLCREGAATTVRMGTAVKKNYKVELAGAASLDPNKTDPTGEGQKNVEAALNDLSRDSTTQLAITLYAANAAELKFAEQVKIKAVQFFTEKGIAADRITATIAKAGGVVSVIDLDVITPAAEAVTTTAALCCGPQIAPGHVLLVPIANLKNRNSINPLQPKTSRRILLEIEAYLKKLTSPFVKIHAKNPVYEQVIVAFKVQFYTGTDKGFYLKKLNEEIVQYLTPWAFSENVDVQFGQKIYASSIINFIEERPYVDFITDFVMGVCKDECCPEKPAIGEYRKAIKDNAVTEKRVASAAAAMSEAAAATTTQRDSVAETLAGICGCNELEILIGEGADTRGEIVARPSTARSILVSVPQHVIIPYEAPVRPTPCELRKNRPAVAEAVLPPAPVAEATPAPVAEVKPAPVVAEPVKDTVKTEVPPAKDAITTDLGRPVATEVKAEQPVKDVTGSTGTKLPDLVKINPPVKAEDITVKKPVDTIKGELVTGITKAGDLITTKLADAVKADVAGSKAAGTTKEKLTVPAKAAPTAAKPVKKAVKAAPKLKKNK
jgi:hypothetical protein